LDHGQEITRSIIGNKPHWTTAPGSVLLKIRKPLAVLLIVGIKHCPRTAIE
jgi:hypothetical protein